jgi:hypothetical protein
MVLRAQRETATGSGSRNPQPASNSIYQVPGPPSANLAAKRSLESQADYLLIVRKPRGPTKTPQKQPEQRVKPIKKSELAGAIVQEPTADLLIIPETAIPS